MAEAGTRSGEGGQDRVAVIRQIDHPLGFFVLALLIVEGFLGISVFPVPSEQRISEQRIYVVLIMAALFLVVVLIVALITIFRPGNLTNAQVIRRMDELTTKLVDAEKQLKDLTATLDGAPFNATVVQIVRAEINRSERSIRQPESPHLLEP